MTDPRYPIGTFHAPEHVTAAQREQWIESIARMPDHMRKAVHRLSHSQLDTPYREGGWMVRQVVHHVPDSHMNAYIRFKLALTEDLPIIKPYNEHTWAHLGDTQTTPIEVSLNLLEALHARWVKLLRSMSAADFARGFAHPELMAPSENPQQVLEAFKASSRENLPPYVLPLSKVLGMYAWHGEHHVAQIQALRQGMGW